MSRAIVLSLQGPFTHAYSLMVRFIDECPASIFVENTGGWPIWQQVYHALYVTVCFTLQPGEIPPDLPFDRETGLLLKPSDELCTRETLQQFAVTVKQRADAFIDTLNDADLTSKNAIMSDMFGREVTQATTLSMLAGHMFYHLGADDAALRNHGLKGML